jgi:PAS domain S-box-containing protein
LSFRLKTILGIALIESLLLIILIIGGMHFLRTSNQDQLATRADSTAHLFAASTKDAVIATDLATLDTLVQELLRNPELIYARVIGAGQILAEGGDPTALARAYRQDHSVDSVHDGLFDTHADIRAASHLFGRVELGMSTDAIAQVLNEATHWTVLIATLEVVLVALFSFVLGAFLTAQLRRLKQASEQIAENGPGFQTEITGHDEIADVSQAFNQMSRRLAASYQELQDSLEAHRRLSRLAARNEAAHAATLAASMDGIITINAEDRITEINQIAADMFGHSPAEIVGADLGDTLIPPQVRQAHRDGFAHFLRTGEGPILKQRLMLEGLHADGHTFPIELTICPVATEDSLLFTAFVRDITAQQAAEQELKLAARALEADEGIFITDAEVRIVRINKAFTRITGYTAQDALGKNPKILASGRHSPDFYQAMWNDLEQQGAWRGEIENKRKNGEIYSESLSIVAVREQHERATHYVAHFTDISVHKQNAESLKKARQQAEEANQAKSRFLATMSHEIRTPLNAIINMNSLLLESDLDPEQQQFARSAVNGGRLLLGLLNNVLDFSKIEAGKLSLEEQWFCPRDTVSAIAELFSGEAQNKGIELAVVVTGGFPAECFADALRLRQILTNLVGNAIKFTEEGGVTLRLGYQNDRRQQQGRLQLDVFDTGIGIAEEQQALLFNEFMQADNSDTRRHQGTGLGLTISQRLVELMGGVIECFSRPGDGTRFSVDIPTRSRGEPDAKLSCCATSFEDALVLLYSRNRVIRNSIEEQLSQHAIACRSLPDAPTLESTLDELDAASRVVILLDTPSGADEAQHTRYIKTLPSRYPPLRFVRLAAMSEVGAIEASKKAGFSAVVRKPARTQSLLHYLAKVLGDPLTGPTQNKSPERQAAPRDEAKPGYAKILLVEDSQSNVAVASAALRRGDHEVTVAWNGQEALYAVEDTRFDIIFMDISMPVMNGLEATQKIRQGASINKHTPIIAMTANAFAEDRERCLAAGMDDFMTKPIDIKRLRETVAHWLKERASAPPQAPISAPAAQPSATQPSGETEPASIDIGVLKRLADDTSEQIMPMLLNTYLEETRKRIPRLLSLHETSQLTELSHEAHTLKSSSGTFGAHQLQELARIIEQAAKNAEQAILDAAMKRLSASAERSLSALQQQLNKWSQ